ncbi:hypothetical protein K501DRAFT_337983 [Backusella circina FSU 941]|nr:hypothetical protein K501DRAFT_337983 [Backusella circina FSU 941]
MSAPIDVFISNLKLLGFEKSAHCKGLLSSVSLTRDMFTHGASNTRQFEATSHFLFKTLDKTQCIRRFKTCWPLQEYMRHSREYRSIAFRWLEEIKQSSVIMQHIRLRKSYFEDCRGAQFEHIMVAFSTFVLETVLLEDTDIDKDVLTLNSEEFSQRIQHDIKQAAQSFNEKSNKADIIKKEWMTQGKEIMSRLNQHEENTAFSSITEIEQKSKQRVEEVMPKIKHLKIKFKKSQANNEKKELIHKICTILTTKQSENGIYILPTLPKATIKPFTLLGREDEKEEKEFRDLFQKENTDALHNREKVSPHKEDIEIIEIVDDDDDQMGSVKVNTPLRSESPYKTTQHSISTPQNTNTTPYRTPVRTPQHYIHSAVSSIFPDLGSVESIRHEEPPWTPDDLQRQRSSHSDLFDLNSETPIRGGLFSPYN